MRAQTLLREPGFAHGSAVHGGALHVEGVDARQLVAEFGSPLFVVSEAQLRANYRAFAEAFSAAWTEGPVRVLPAIKANLSLALRLVLNDEGAGCDVFGGPELDLALHAGVDPRRISLNGPLKPISTLERAAEVGARVTIDNLAELRALIAVAERARTRVAVMLRLRPQLPGLDTPSELNRSLSVDSAAQRYKMGIPDDQLAEALALATGYSAIDLRGVHVHCGRHLRGTLVREVLARAVIRRLERMCDQAPGWRPSTIDLGGGYAAPHDGVGLLGTTESGGDRATPSPRDHAGVIAWALRDEARARGLSIEGVALEIEPGRAIYGSAGLHLATVQVIKRELGPPPRRWIFLDTTTEFLAGGEDERHTVVPVGDVMAAPAQVADLVGATCNADRIVPDAALPELQPGDVVAFLGTGAYHEAGASNFNALPRPAAVLVSDGRAQLMRAAETAADVFARERVPAWLRHAPEPTRGVELSRSAS